MGEKMMPSPEELKAIQEKHMTNDEIKMSEEREATIKAASGVIEREKQKESEGILSEEEREQKAIDSIKELIERTGIKVGRYANVSLNINNPHQPFHGFAGNVTEIQDKAILLRDRSYSETKAIKIDFKDILTISRGEYF